MKQRRFNSKRVLSGNKNIFLKGTSAKKYNSMWITLGDKNPYYSTVKNWLARFRTGHLSTKDEERSADQLK
jgi:hypothetical protein